MWGCLPIFKMWGRWVKQFRIGFNVRIERTDSYKWDKGWHKLKQINNIYIVYEQNLEIANAIGLANPLIQNFEGFVQSNILTEPKDSFYQGSVVLEKRMNHLKSIIEKLKEENYYNPISENSIIISSNFKNTNKTIFFALIIGMLFSFFVILFRSILR